MEPQRLRIGNGGYTPYENETNADALGTVAQVINYQLSIIDTPFSYLPHGRPCPQRQGGYP